MNVIRIGTLAQFVEEVPIDHMLRMDLTERWVKSQLPTKELQLHLQGINDRDELVWLMYSHRVTWLSTGLHTAVDQSIYDGMLTIRKLLSSHLQDHGYQVRLGSHALPADYEPVKGHFEIFKWHKQDDGTFTVTLLDEEERTDDE